MEAKRKRSLLAGIDGQAARLAQAGATSAQRGWQRIAWALAALKNQPMDGREIGYCRRLERRVMALRDATGSDQPQTLLVHRLTLTRSDCVLWQIYLRRAPR
ncbi:MAG: hypothetical protein KY410_02475 [Proteobacteria bacterium]|nr:hypothetical protein [Pseudomonadota bacterium]